jgi:hypothetical protein
VTRPFIVMAGVAAGLCVAALIGQSPRPPKAQLVPDTQGSLSEISIHYCAGFHAASSATLAGLLSQLEPDVRVNVVVEAQSEFEKLKLFLDSDTESCPRLYPIVTGFPISPWSKDRYGTMVTRHGPALCVPHPDIAGRRISAAGDGAVPGLLARKGLELRHLPFRFDGGDLIASPDHIFMAANCLARNQPYDQEGRRRLVAEMGAAFGKSIVVLGKSPTDVPAHHIGMYLTPLDNKTIMVGDPDWGQRVYSQITANPPETLTGEGLGLAPFRYVRQALEAKGFNVIPIPLVVTPRAQVYITYNNGILETRAGKRIFYMPTYDIPHLDDMAAAVYERHGITVKRVPVANLYRHTGSLRCLVGIMSRK